MRHHFQNTFPELPDIINISSKEKHQNKVSIQVLQVMRPHGNRRWCVKDQREDVHPVGGSYPEPVMDPITASL